MNAFSTWTARKIHLTRTAAAILVAVSAALSVSLPGETHGGGGGGGHSGGGGGHFSGGGSHFGGGGSHFGSSSSHFGSSSSHFGFGSGYSSQMFGSSHSHGFSHSSLETARASESFSERHATESEQPRNIRSNTELERSSEQSAAPVHHGFFSSLFGHHSRSGRSSLEQPDVPVARNTVSGDTAPRAQTINKAIVPSESTAAIEHQADKSMALATPSEINPAAATGLNHAINTNRPTVEHWFHSTPNPPTAAPAPPAITAPPPPRMVYSNPIYPSYFTSHSSYGWSGLGYYPYNSGYSPGMGYLSPYLLYSMFGMGAAGYAYPYASPPGGFDPYAPSSLYQNPYGMSGTIYPNGFAPNGFTPNAYGYQNPYGVPVSQYPNAYATTPYGYQNPYATPGAPYPNGYPTSYEQYNQDPVAANVGNQQSGLAGQYAPVLDNAENPAAPSLTPGGITQSGAMPPVSHFHMKAQPPGLIYPINTLAFTHPCLLANYMYNRSLKQAESAAGGKTATASAKPGTPAQHARAANPKAIHGVASFHPLRKPPNPKVTPPSKPAATALNPTSTKSPAGTGRTSASN